MQLCEHMLHMDKRYPINFVYVSLPKVLFKAARGKTKQNKASLKGKGRNNWTAVKGK